MLSEIPGFSFGDLCGLEDGAIEWLYNAAVRVRARKKKDMYDMVNAVHMEESDRKKLIKQLSDELSFGIPKEEKKQPHETITPEEQRKNILRLRRLLSGL